MSGSTVRRGARTLAVGTCMTALLMAGPALAGTSSTNLSNGAELSLTVDSPETGDTFLVPPGSSDLDVPASGTASVGEGEPDVAWLYIFDVSGSTVDTACGTGTILDCEKQAVNNLNAQVVSDGSALEVGIGLFGEGGDTADIQNTAGDQLLTAPDDAGVATVVGSLVSGGVGQFTAKSVGSDWTNYTAGLQAADTLLGATSATFKNVVFVSDGLSNLGGGGFAATLAAVQSHANTTIYPFAVGPGANCTGGTDGDLDDMGDCVNVPDPTDLPDIITNITDTELLDVTGTVDGAPVTVSSPVPPAQAGPTTVGWSTTMADLEPGHHEVCVTATGEGPLDLDPAAIDSTTRCETVSVFGFDLQPPHAVNELGEDNVHTVTATVTGPAGELAGWPVDFDIVAGPNAGDAGTCDPAPCTTDASGQVDFTYTVPVEPDSLGTDTIAGTVDINGDTATIEVTKLWQDTTPPVAACPEGPNPGGNTPAAPGNGGQGQNQDGFYHLEATDDVWPDDALQLFVTDTGTGIVFGPFANGDDIKYTEANGAEPSVKPGAGAVEHRIKGQGDAQVTAMDGSGNLSDPVDCLVPNPPM